MPTYPTYKLGDLILDAIGGDWGKDPGFQDETYELAYCIRGAEYKNWADDNGSTAVLRKIKCGNLLKRQLKEGDIIVEISGGGPEQPVGRTEVITKKVLSNFNGSKVLCTNFLRLIRPNLELVDAVFLNYYLKFFYSTGEIIKYQAGSNNLRNLKFKDYLNLPIPLPPLPTQRAIVSRIETLFAELDKGVEKLKTAQQQLKAYRQAVLNDCLTKGSEKWKHVTIGDIVERVEYGSSSKSEKNGKVPVLRMGNIQNGRFDWNDLVYSNDENEIAKYLLEKDDVLFNRTNSPELVGKTAIYKGERPAIFAGYLIRLHRKKNLINADYLNYYLNSDIARNYGNSVKSDGVNQSNINGQKLKTYPLFLPSLPEQQRIVQEIETRLSACDEVEKQIAESLQQAEALRQSILKKAFSGELV